MAIDWLARRAALSPERVALYDGPGGPAIDFRTFDRRAARAAAALASRGVGRGDRIAALADTSVAYLELVFAANKLGAVLVNLNWRLAEPELRRIVEHARPRLVLADAGHRDQAAALLDGPPVALEALADHPPTAVAAPALGDDDPWLVCYTGGSTGVPRGVVMTHRMVTWNAINTAASWGLGPDDVAILNAPLFHTGGLHVFTTPLVHLGGASIVCRRFDPAEVLALVSDGPATLLFGVPTMLQLLVEHPAWARASFDRLRLVISGGAPAPRRLFDAWFARDVAFRTGYGLTEAGPNNFWLPPELSRAKPGAVGWPLLHVEARLVDGDGRPVDGADQVGELCLRGPHVMAGYLDNPAASAAAIDPDGWLHTGDLARRDGDGAMWIVGRAREMFISGGENVYPPEVEDALCGHPAVAEAAVLGAPDPRWGEIGVAFVALRDGVALDESRLDAYLRGVLAGYKRPRRYVFGPLPRTGAGKIDRAALRARLR
jgi:fatty-acyl-CoA synthase